MKQLIRIILFPFVPFYYAITWLRNKLYDVGVFKSKSYQFPVICVGNLSVGGTGKTPMIVYLVSLLKENYRVATLSRGYKRKTSGFYFANTNASAATLGDEPFLFYRKFKKSVLVAVDANRQRGIANLLQQEPATQVVLLDDAYQHRSVQAGCNILLTTYANLFSDDFMLPTGNLREPKSGASRAHIIVVTKCPEKISSTEKTKIINKLKPTKSQQVYFSKVVYSDFVYQEAHKISLQSVKHFTLVTGIANAAPLVKYLKQQGLAFKHLNFSDHYQFSKSDIDAFKQMEMIITTEKDYVRLLDIADLKQKLYYLPISIQMDNAEKFNNQIISFVQANL